MRQRQKELYSLARGGERRAEPVTSSSAIKMRVSQYHGQLSGHWPDERFFSFWLMENSLFLGQQFCSSFGFWPELRSSPVVLGRIAITKKYNHHTPASPFVLAWSPSCYPLAFPSVLFLALSFFLSVSHCFLVICSILFVLCHPELRAPSLWSRNW